MELARPRELAKLEEVYRNGFIGEEEYLRRRLLLLTLHDVQDGDSTPTTKATIDNPQASQGADMFVPSCSVIGQEATFSVESELENQGHAIQCTSEEEQGHHHTHATLSRTPTPGWRLIADDSGYHDFDEHDEDQDDEDTDDESYRRRHEPYERWEIATGLLYHTVAELRKMLAEQRLSTCGAKEELAKRLALHYLPGQPVFTMPVKIFRSEHS